MTVRAVVLGAVLVIGCRPVSRVTGKVQLDHAAPAAGVIIRVAGEQGSVVTDDSGDFEVESAEARPMLIATGEGLRPKTQSQRGGPDPVLFQFSAVGSLTGTARRGGLPSGNSGVGVSVPGTALTTAADDSGSWMLEVPVGTWLVQAVARGFDGATSAPVTVERGQTLRVEPLVLQLAGYGFNGALRGRVERVTSTDHDGVRVLVEGAGRTTVTTDGGHFEIEGVPEGSYTLALEYDGLVERVPGVVVVRGADGFVVDRNLYRLADRAIPLMGASRVDSTTASALTAQGQAAAWFADDEADTRMHVRWVDATAGVAREAGDVAPTWASSDLLAPSLGLDGGWLVWASGGELMATSVPGGERRVLAENYRRPASYHSRRSTYVAPITPGGLVAYEGWQDGSNVSALQVVSLDAGAPLTVLPGSSLYNVRFVGEALLTMTDVSSNNRQGRLGWWKDGVERALLQTDADRLLNFDLPRFAEVSDGNRGTHVVDLEQGRVVLSHMGGEGRLSEDNSQYAWPTQTDTRLLELNSGVERVVANEALWVRQGCVEGGVVVGTRPGSPANGFADGQLVAAVGGAVTTLSLTSSLSQCADGRAFWFEQGALVVAQLPSSGPAVVLSDGVSPVRFGALARPVSGRVWWATDPVNMADPVSGQSSSWGTLWVTPIGGGSPQRVGADVSLYPHLVLPSVDGALLAFRAVDGLYVVRSDGTFARRVATGVSSYEWLTPRQLVFIKRPPTAPLRFQGGVYVARFPQ